MRITLSVVKRFTETAEKIKKIKTKSRDPSQAAAFFLFHHYIIFE